MIFEISVLEGIIKNSYVAKNQRKMPVGATVLVPCLPDKWERQLKKFNLRLSRIALKRNATETQIMLIPA